MTKLKMAASAQDGTVSRSLFLHLLPLETEETTCKKRNADDISSTQANDRPFSLPRIQSSVQSPSRPNVPLNAKETHYRQSNNGRTVGVFVQPKHQVPKIRNGCWA
jgi:hypothetical protein